MKNAIKKVLVVYNKYLAKNMGVFSLPSEAEAAIANDIKHLKEIGSRQTKIEIRREYYEIEEHDLQGCDEASTILEHVAVILNWCDLALKAQGKSLMTGEENGARIALKQEIERRGLTRVQCPRCGDLMGDEACFHCGTRLEIIPTQELTNLPGNHV